MLEIRNITKKYIDNKNEHIIALDEVSISFPDTGLVVINGTSGCGKTTLLNILGGLDKPTSGEVWLNNSRIDDKDEKWWDSFRAGSLGFVYQDFNLLDNMTIRQNIELPLELMNIPEDEKQKRIDNIADKLGIAEYMNKKAGKLSGGQKQRVAIARAVVTESKIILADEPTGNLDKKNSKNVFQTLKEIAKEHLVIVVTHDSTLASEYADRWIQIDYGKIVDDSGDNEDNKDNKIVADKACVNEKKDDILSEGNSAHESTQRKLSMKKCLQFASEAMKQRTARCFVSVMIFSITMLLMLVLCEMVYRNDSVPITNHIKEYNRKILPVYVEVPGEYSNITGDEKISCGRKLYDIVSQCTDKSRIIQIGGSYNVHLGDDVYESATNIYISEVNEKYFTYEGRLPEKTDEIAISKVLADKLKLTGVQNGINILLEDKQYTVTAIVTKICDKDVHEIYVDSGYDSNLLEENLLFFSTNALTDKTVSSKIYMSGFGVTKFTNLFYQTTVYNDICSTDDVLELVAGRMPEKDNEILISEYWLELEGKKSEDYIGKEYKLINIYEEQYGYAYWNMLNMYDYFGESITIVGVATGKGDYYISPSMYEKIFNEVKTYYEKHNFLLVDDSEIEEDIFNILNNDVKVSDTQLAKVYEMMLNIDSFKMILLVVSAVITFLAILQMISLYSYSINDNKKTIGVLRTMGVNKADTKKIFTVECIVVSTISFIISIVMGIFATGIINNYIDKNVLNYDGFEFLRMRLIVVLIIGVVACLLSVISVLIPLRKYSKMKVIELIK